MPIAKIERRGRCTQLVVDGKPVPPMAFTSRHYDDDAYMEGLFRGRIRVFFVCCTTPWNESTWKGSEGFANLDKRIRFLLGHNPDAVFLLRVHLDAPGRWLDDHPLELLCDADGKRDLWPGGNGYLGREYAERGTFYSLASDVWVKDAGNGLAALIGKVKNAPWGDRVVGYFLNAGGTEEWYFPKRTGRDEHPLDYSSAFQRYYRNWLRRKYGSDAVLRKAWNDPQATLDVPRLPTRAERRLCRVELEWDFFRVHHAADFGAFLDPAKSQFLVDYLLALNESVADSILSLAGVVKASSPGALCGAFYGEYCWTLYQDMGTHSLQKILESPLVDFCSSPSTYNNRGPGGLGALASVTDAFRFRGKLFWSEEDFRTHKSDVPWERIAWGSWDKASTLEMLKREYVKCLVQGAQGWWFENSDTELVFKDPDLFGLFQKLQGIGEAHSSLWPQKTSEVLVVYDERSLFYADQESLKDATMWTRALELERMGLPFDICHTEDLSLPSVPVYKVYIFVNAYALDAEKRATIRGRLAREGATAIWLFGAGLIQPDRDPPLSLKYIEELTGFRFGVSHTPRQSAFRLTVDGAALLQELDAGHVFGLFERPVHGSINYSFYTDQSLPQGTWPDVPRQIETTFANPFLFVDDPGAAILGTYVAPPAAYGAKGGSEGAFAMKDTGGFRSVYLGTRAPQASLLRALARLSGAHIWCESEDVLFADERLIGFHASSVGRKTIRLPRACSVREVLENEVYAENAAHFSFECGLGKTMIFAME